MRRRFKGQYLKGQYLKGQELKGQELKRQELKGQDLKGQESKRQEFKRQESKSQESKRQELKRQELKGQCPLALIASIVLLGLGSCSGAGPDPTSPGAARRCTPARHTAALKRLGAYRVPAGEIPTGKPMLALQVHGWRCCDARRSLRWAEYAAMLDLSCFRRTRDPKLLYALIAVTLDRIREQNVKVEEPGPVVAVYEAGIALEEPAAAVLGGALAASEAQRLYDRYRDSRLIHAFPTPSTGERRYLRWLRAFEGRRGPSVFDRWSVRRLLHRMSPAADGLAFSAYSVDIAHKVIEDRERLQIYTALIEIGNAIAWRYIGIGLLNDPSGQCRASLLYELTRRKVIRPILEAVLALVDQQTRADLSGRRVLVDLRALTSYLEAARANPSVDGAARTKITAALARMAGVGHTP